ncbi:hypothetical protein [Nocardiopsis composta]|uniref:Ferritin-like domain-containing protein n=1 Tax=Nocardiopsis composta TaxID=157465 RepID=A0A7W8VG08_9ACTN|nr:hypothetical protein [Nocardiopsis composta]MBB5435131.1 hypothetical protein [Nocardiopsis composta]
MAESVEGDGPSRRADPRSGGIAVTRRTALLGALAAAAAAGVSGCGVRWYPSEVGQDERILRGAVTAKERLVARYRAAVEAGEGPAGLLESFLSHHEEHLAALRDRLPEDAADGEAGQDRGSAESGENGAASPEPVPEEPPSTADLQAAEEASAVARARECAQVLEPALAQLLASVGACEIGHAHLLAEEAT